MRDLALADIPTFPAIAVTVLNLLSTEDVRVAQLAEAIDSDPLFSAQVLRVANSPLFGLRTQIDSVHLAIVTLGLTRIQALTLSVATANYMRAEFNTKELHRCWCHCIASATICRSLARACSLPVDRAYTAGLLHDIGRLGLLVAYPREYAAMLSDAGTQPHVLLEREVERFGVDHSEAGQFLVGQWGLPSTFDVITGRHHEKPSTKSSDWHRASYLACQMADSLGFSVVKPCEAPEFENLCKMLPPAARHGFQAQAEILKAVIGLGIDAHDFTVSSAPEPAATGFEFDEPLPEELSAPVTGPTELKPPLFARTLSTLAARGPIAVAAVLVFLVAVSFAIFILIR